MPFGDFLTILIAIISLYFVVISLNSWKIQLSHQTTQNLYFEFLKLEYDLLKLQGEFYKLKQDGNPQKQHADYIEYIKDKNFSNRFEELDLKISSQKLDIVLILKKFTLMQQVHLINYMSNFYFYFGMNQIQLLIERILISYLKMHVKDLKTYEKFKNIETKIRCRY